MVFINGIKPDSNGSVLLTFYTGASSPYAMWTSLTIQGMPSPDVIAGDSARTGGGLPGIKNWGIVSPIRPAFANAADSTDSLPLSSTLLTYPNPFHDNVTVKLDLPKSVNKVRLVIADANGRVLRQQEFGNLPAGTWLQSVNLGNLPRGIYFINVYGVPGGTVKPARLMKLK